MIKESGTLDNTRDEPRWIWKDGHGGYEDLLRSMEGQEMAKGKDWSLATTESNWYYDIRQYIRSRTIPSGLDRIKAAAFLRKASKYREQEGVLFHLWKERWRRCLTRAEIAPALHRAHDEAGHFASGITVRFLREFYWPSMLKNVTDYIEGCLTCAKYGTALRSKTLSKFLVSSPNEVWGIEFIGPFPKAENSKHRYILLLIDYFTRFVWTYPCVTNNSAETIECLKDIFEKEGVPVGIYADEGPHFQKATQEFCKEMGVVWIPAPVAAKRSVGMVEKANDLLQRVLVKDGNPLTWPNRLTRSTFHLNRREIAHLGFSPFELHKGHCPEGVLDTSFPSYHRHTLTTKLKQISPEVFQDFTPPLDEHLEAAVARVLSLQQKFEEARMLTAATRERQKDRFDRGVKQRSFHPGQLVMLYDGVSAKKKLRPS
ncbi:hypothetical protein K3495_g14303 [Podosphaera aphanis]|nr:hypothetical protein K3495_g14303 [Podosphaera aphanis]